jgi:hypothetical protein
MSITSKKAAKLMKQIKDKETEIKVLNVQLEALQDACDHKGQQTGYNERDGAWGNPCPKCGYSY